RFGDTLVVRASIYDVASGERRRVAVLHLPSDRLADASRRFAALADTLLLGRATGRPGADVGGTDVLAALQAYQRGQAYLERWADACREYARVLRTDSSDFRAWYGLGDCRSRDRVVVADARSRTGWRFRSSKHAAVEAYVRALDLAPSFLLAFRGSAYGRLAQ